MNNFVYEIEGVDYINLTNKCTNACTFCIRNNHDGMSGKSLWLESEPTADDIIAILEKNRRDVVFCGFGEPMIKLDVLREVAAFVKSYGGKVRVNTNGHANIYHGRNVVPEISQYVDVFSISLNSYCAQEYDKICKSIYGPSAFDHMVDFAKECIAAGNRVVMSALDIIGDEAIAKCREFAENLGAEFRERFYY